MDALWAYLHFTAIFLLFAFLTAEAMVLRGTLDAERIRLLARLDAWYFGSAIAALLTGGLRLALGAKGAAFYTGAWPLYVKLALFVAVGLLSIGPTRAFLRWRRALRGDAGYTVPAAEIARQRKAVMVELHLAAFIPLAAVVMARGMGY